MSTGQLEVILISYTFYAIPLAISYALGWGIFRKRICVQFWDMLLLIGPYTAWLVLLLCSLSVNVKTLTNGVFEPLFLGIIVGVGFVIRCMLGNNSKKELSLEVLIGGILAAFLLAFLFPTLPE